MRLATIDNGTRDGRLIVVSPQGDAFAYAPAATMQELVEGWDALVPALRAIAEFPELLADATLLAPVPRAWQWLDGSAFQSHGDLMDAVLGITKPKTDVPLMYQGMSDTFMATGTEARFPSTDLGIDFEGEFGVIIDAVPMGTTAAEAMKHIRLIVQINDWSLRTLAGPEMKTGFGWVGAKPACAMAPFAVTPDELGDAWKDGRVCLDLLVDWNGKRFGAANGHAMGFGFHELVAHAARTRDLVAGTVIGSGTVSNENFREIGSSCIAERRGIEVLDQGEPKTAFMAFGDTVRMEAVDAAERAPFGVLHQRVVQA
ncbi:MAG: fumarylacetoacetate hydrolase family protein [Novosphingobium sp.]